MSVYTHTSQCLKCCQDVNKIPTTNQSVKGFRRLATRKVWLYLDVVVKDFATVCFIVLPQWGPAWAGPLPKIALSRFILIRHCPLIVLGRVCLLLFYVLATSKVTSGRVTRVGNIAPRSGLETHLVMFCGLNFAESWDIFYRFNNVSETSFLLFDTNLITLNIEVNYKVS